MTAKTREDSLSDQTVTFVISITGAEETASSVESDVAVLRVADEVERDQTASEAERTFADAHANGGGWLNMRAKPD